LWGGFAGAGLAKTCGKSRLDSAQIYESLYERLGGGKKKDPTSESIIEENIIKHAHVRDSNKATTSLKGTEKGGDRLQTILEGRRKG